MTKLYVNEIAPRDTTGVHIPGHVIQTSENEMSTNMSITATGVWNDVVSVSITPRYSNSKFNIKVCGIYYINNANTNISTHFNCTRNGLVIPGHNWSQSSSGMSSHYLYYRESAITSHIPSPFNFEWVDVPSNSSPVTYTFKVLNGNSSLYVYKGFSMHVQEIAQ